MSELIHGDIGEVNKRALGGVLAVAALVGGGALFATRGGETPASADSNPTEWLDVSGQDNPSCVEIVDKAGTGETYKLEFDNNTFTLVKSDIGANQEGRLWTNSMRAPFESDNTEAEVKASLCEDAPFSVATAYTLGNVIYKGKRLANTEAGKWLKPYADLKPEELDEKAEYLLGTDLKRTEVEAHLERNDEFTVLAENLSAVLTNLNAEGLKTGKTDVDVSYDDNAFVGVDRIPEMVAKHNQFKDAEAFMFGALLKGKDEDCPTPIIGFNTGIGADGNPKNGDQRPETFVPNEECEETTSTAGKGETTTTGRRGTTTTTLPDKRPWSPVPGGEDDVEAPEPGPDYPTTSTTAPTDQTGPSTTTTTIAGNGTTTTVAGPCGSACE